MLFAISLFLVCSISLADEGDYIINNYEELCKFAELVAGGDTFEGRNVFLTASVEAKEDFKISGVFSGNFNALGNSVKVSGALFESLSGATVKNIDLDGIMLAESAENSLIDSCIVTFEDAEDAIPQSAFIGSARGCKLYNCIGDVSCFALDASNCEFVNSLSKRSVNLVQNAEDCTFSNILSLVPLEEEREGVMIPDPDMSAKDISDMMNSSRTDADKENLWSVVDGKAVPHTHKHEKKVTESTCESLGKTEYICSCGDTPLTLIDTEAGYTPHTEGELSQTIEPTCTEGGYTEYICAVCGKSIKTDEKEPLGHITEIVGQVDATCVSSGYTGDTVCTVCGVTVERGKKKSATKVHTWQNPKITKEPTGDENGEITYYCAYCDATRTEVIPAIGHEIGEYTYFDETYHSAECSCGDIIKEEHNFFEVGVTKEPSVEEDGEALYECSVCHAQKVITLPAIGHSVSVWTPLDEEFHGGMCSCGEYETLPHSWDEGTLISDGISDMSGLKRTLFVCGVCEIEHTLEETVELPVVEVERFSTGTKVLIAAVLILLVAAGAGSCVYVKYSDRK